MPEETETFKCEKCDRTFNSKEALEMHNKAKHSSAAESKTKNEAAKPVKIPMKKLRNWGIFILITGLVIWGIFVLIQGNSPAGEDFSRVVPSMGAEHISVGSQLPEYNSNPPTSGPHYSTPARPGFREEIIADGHLIHSLEHGLIWVSYHPRIGTETEKLREIVGPFTVVAQRDANDEDIAIASWGRLDTFNLEDGTIDADDLQRINDFVLRYSNKGPESIPAGQHGGI